MLAANKVYTASCVHNAKGVLTGHLAMSPSGNLVKLRPKSVAPAISDEGKQYIRGLKDGWRLASEADYRKKEAEEAARSRVVPRTRTTKVVTPAK